LDRKNGPVLEIAVWGLTSWKGEGYIKRCRSHF